MQTVGVDFVVGYGERRSITLTAMQLPTVQKDPGFAPGTLSIVLVYASSWRLTTSD